MKVLRAAQKGGLRCELGSWYKKKVVPFPQSLFPFFPSLTYSSALPLHVQPCNVKLLERTSSCTLAKCPGTPVD